MVSADIKKKAVAELKRRHERLLDDAWETALEDTAMFYRMDPDTLEEWAEEEGEN